MECTPQQETQESRLLEIERLTVTFPRGDGSRFKAVNSLSLHINRQESLAVVGESGCGKSVTAFSVMGLLRPPATIDSGRILFADKNLLSLTEKQMQQVRGKEMAMVFQEPMTSLNPVLKIGFQITEAITAHRTVSFKEASKQAINLLRQVGIQSPEKRIDSYPHQLSGGMKQRVMIAMALALEPKLLIADEPTTALDVTVQAQILELVDSLRKSFGMSLMLITHNLGIVANRSDRTIIMYAGSAVETAPTGLLLKNPQHPYTKGLIASLPQSSEPGTLLPTIKGTLRTSALMTNGCPFASRCEYALERCKSEPQQLVETAPGHFVACWRSSEL